MENSNNNSREIHQTPKFETTSTRTLDFVVDEIQEIVTNTHWIETCLARIKSSGYQYEHCWVKNGSIGVIWYMKRKKVLRIQVSASELHGEYHKAYCVILPITNIDLQASDSSRVRNFPVKQNPEFGTTTHKSENITNNKKQ